MLTRTSVTKGVRATGFAQRRQVVKDLFGRPRLCGFARNPARRRLGSSYLEIQVAMVLLSIGMAGLYSMSVVQTKQTVRLTNVLSPTDVPALNQSTDEWARKLGVYASLDAASIPHEDPIPYVYHQQVVDNADSGARYHQDKDDTYGWTDWNYSRAYRANARYHYSYGYVGSRSEFRFDNLPVGEYEVLTTYPEFTSLGTAIPHQVFDDKDLKTTVYLDQRIAPSEVYYDGKYWDRIAVVQINSGKLKVRQLDGPGSTRYIIADAFMVRSARSFQLLSVSKTPDGGATAVLQAP